MPWKTMEVREQRVQFVVAATRREKSFSALCASLAYRVHRQPVAEALSATRGGGDRRAQLSSPSQSATDDGRVRRAGGGVAAALSRLGSA